MHGAGSIQFELFVLVIRNNGNPNASKIALNWNAVSVERQSGISGQLARNLLDKLVPERYFSVSVNSFVFVIFCKVQRLHELTQWVLRHLELISIAMIHSSSNSPFASPAAPAKPVIALDASRMNGLMPIALVRSDDAGKKAVREALDQMGHASVAFDTASDLAAALRAGRRFGLLLLAPQAGWNWHELLAAANGVPLLLMTEALAPSPLAVEDAALFEGRIVDFMTASPLQGGELQWRVRSLLAKSLEAAQSAVLARSASGTDELIWNNYHFLPRNRVVHCRGEEIRLRPREYELALLMFANMDMILDRQWLRTTLWARTAKDGSRALDTCVSSIRKKLALNPGNGLELRSLHGRGYRLAPMHSGGPWDGVPRAEQA